MLVYPNAKINIGLYVTEKRADGFHNLETVFYPIALTDILEVKPAMGTTSEFKNTGIGIDCPTESNLVMRAYELLRADYNLPAVRVHLHKLIPFGAGLGGGSSDAAFMLKALNELFNIGIDKAKLLSYAAQLGSDCSFFIHNRAMFAHGRGELLENLPLSLSGYQIVIVKPEIRISTSEAYGTIHPRPAGYNLRHLGTFPIEHWRDTIANDFEEGIFAKHPRIPLIKSTLYDMGALWSSMTGSGSAVIALFRETTDIQDKFPDCFVWKDKIK